jgi:hypothetical protein
MNTVHQYLCLCRTYADHLGGLRWSATEDALEFADGNTFAFTEQVALFLEGLAAAGRVLPFVYLLHLLALVRTTQKTPAANALGRAFIAAGRPLRNAGAFCAVLCRDLPETAVRVPRQEVLDQLRGHPMPIPWYVVSFHGTSLFAEVPPLAPADFERYVCRQLEAYSPDDLRDWMRHGRGPVREAAEELSRALPPPRTLASALSALLERPRLAGARPFVAQLVSALALPHRRLAPPELPIGGYTDVTTHGNPDQLLPGQLALDEWDFLRRFADRELLFFRREEPHARTEHELVVLLDQGVRTWGDVRLVLSAAVLALGRQAERQHLPFLVTATSAGGALMDPVQAEPEALGTLLEASDLSPHPGPALECVLQGSARAGRDVVLLTHPRALQEEELRAAGRRVGPGTRLFAVALDGGGRVELSELKHGAPVPVRQFRVDLSAAAAPLPGISREANAAWQGDVEPIGYPFRFGLAGPVLPGLIDFDHEGRCLLIASQGGMLHAFKVDGSELEVLPRGMRDGRVLAQPLSVVGVAGGFVVGGESDNRLVAFHYDLDRRLCKLHELDGRLIDRSRSEWDYSRTHHCLIVHQGSYGCTLDLATGARFVWGEARPEGRVYEAWRDWHEGRVPPGHLNILNRSPQEQTQTPPGPCLYLDANSGELFVWRATPPWEPFVPRADGRPVLRGANVVEARCRGETLGALTFDSRTHAPTLRLFRGPKGAALAEYPAPRQFRASTPSVFALSSDGTHLARQVTDKRVEVRPVAGGTATVATRMGGFSRHLTFMLGYSWLGLRAGSSHYHLLSWGSGELKVQYRRAGPDDTDPGLSPGDWQCWRQSLGYAGIEQVIPETLRYDAQRFLRAALGAITVVSDRFGQVVVLDREQKVVCMFIVFRQQLAGWLPDGTCFGPTAMTGKRAAPEAPAKFGEALNRAAKAGRVRS